MQTSFSEAAAGADTLLMSLGLASCLPSHNLLRIAGEMAQWVKMLADETYSLSSIPWSHIGELTPVRCPLTSTCR